MARRWRAPWVVFRVRRLPPRPRAPRPAPPRVPARRPPSGAAPRPPSLLWAYLGTLGLAVGVLAATRHPSPVTIPVTAPIAGSPSRPSWLSRWLRDAARSPHSPADWLRQGLSGLGGLHAARVDWRAAVVQLAESLTGVRFDDLASLLRTELPMLPAEPSPKTPVPASPGGRDQMMAGLPGQGGRVWAVLGARPVVGIYQTHSRESFWPALPPGTPTPYTTQWDKTIVQVGWWLAQDLYRNGVGVVQSRVDNMADGILASYNLSYYTAKRLLRWYPSVRILIDLHRSQDPGSETTVVVHGQRVARILLVVGTNQLLPNPYWHENYQFALRLARALNQVAPGVVRGNGIETVPYRYNQQLMANDLLIEVGGPDNTLAEERYAVDDLAEAIADVVHATVSPAKP